MLRGPIGKTYMTAQITNIIFAGLGGQGVISASDILADAAFRMGYDVKKSELHGMSQRGGSVSSDVRFGAQVWSPMVPDGEADYMVVLTPDQAEPHRHRLKEGGCLILSDAIDEAQLPNRRSLNVALLGVLSAFLPLAEAEWKNALCARLPERLQESNFQVFALGRAAGVSLRER
jgi:indolepyruvate ferredoxin oxidoreductase beta subunit